MNKPVILSHALELDTAVTVLQEGGYLNSIGVCAMRIVTSQVMSLWIQANKDFSFSLSWSVSGTFSC